MNLSDETRVNPASDLRYLILQRGSARLQVLEIRPGQRVTIGRTPGNTLVVPDRKCSRLHCEIFHGGGTWYVRDNQSRNGVYIDGAKIDGDTVMQIGQIIGVGDFSIQMVPYHPDQPAGELENHPTPLTDEEDFEIIERKSVTQFDRAEGLRSNGVGPRGAADLFKLSQAMQVADDIQSLADTTLDGLRQVIPATMAALLLIPEEVDTPTVDLLKVVSMRVPADQSKELRFSTYLSRQVFESSEAILAHDVPRNSSLARSESLEILSAQSVVCAPIRLEGQTLGVIHLYSTSMAEPLDSRHLEFTLAVADHMAGLVRKARERQKLAQNLIISEQRSKEYQAQLGLESELIGNSPLIQKLKQSIGRVARTDATVLIRGESGVGKELVARALHFNSPRREGPIICVNCAALTETLLESELFGHEKGAFTGATGLKAGKFEQAHGGTLFLDEVGEMTPEIQSKFLRVLETREFERVGGSKTIRVDVRVVTATNRDLEQAVRDGKYRSDLFYRLQVIELYAPALREHAEDISDLARYFVERFVKRQRSKIRGFDRTAIEKLTKHKWPGNVRELRNVIERAVILCDREFISDEDIVLSKLELHPQSTGPAAVPAAPVVATSEKAPDAPQPSESPTGETAFDPRYRLWDSLIQASRSLDDVERLYIEAVFRHCGWNKSQASRILGIERTTLDRRLKKYGIARPDGVEDDDGTEEE
ncbi:MAG: FHA domain-containing protein [Planctomycetota bacterium]|nr:MAG: FHA domain-containing protein [Planctomycetota bacterium]